MESHPETRYRCGLKWWIRWQDVLGGKEIRRQVAILWGEAIRNLSSNLLLYLPKVSNQPISAFLKPNFQGNYPVHSDFAILLPKTRIRNRNDINKIERKRKTEGWPYPVGSFLV